MKRAVTMTLSRERRAAVCMGFSPVWSVEHYIQLLTYCSIANIVSHNRHRASDRELRRRSILNTREGSVRKRGVDRRVQRTRALLQDSLIALMMEKGYEAATVQDIIDRANVGRATFYAHFADKETLLTSRLEDLRSFLSQRQRQAPASLAFSRAMLEHARAHLPVWAAIVGRERGAFVVQRIQAMIADLVAADMKALAFRSAPAERDLAVHYIAGAFMAVLLWWLDHGAR